MGQKNKTVLLWISFFLDLLINLTALYFVYTYLNKQINAPFGKKAMAIALIVALATSLIYLMFNIYTLKRSAHLHVVLIKTVIAHIVAYSSVTMMIMIFSPEKKTFFIFASVCYGISLVILLIKRTISTKLIHKMRASTKNRRKIIIVGSGHGARAFVKQVEENEYLGYNILGCVTDKENPKLNKLGVVAELDEIIKRENPYEVAIAIENEGEIEIKDIINICDQNGVRALIIPITHKYFKSKFQIDMIGDLPVINTRAVPLDNIANAVMKRTMDIVISFIMIILSSPIMLFAAIGVKLSSPGKIIFKQKRVGKNNKTFTMYKFRSMKENEQSDEAWTTDYDPRKTRFGTFLRKTGIDELPQLFNVLFGSMSIIGPRPELPKYVEEYSKTIPLYMVKHQVKPGITGLAQIYGYRGDTSIEKRIEMDIKYIENWTIFSDIKILLVTPFKMFNRNEKYVK
ncbi:MAG: undecaprenyl-phosphate glucose phosphotransferase [Clostridia bacterium]|nr:undecaprenyl-phosphate glucose phosphotransferase [Clostridia bacterium]